MKKSFIAFLLLFALAAAVLTVSCFVLLDWQDDIAITEITEYGHISAAEGLEIQLKVWREDQLLWKSVFAVEKEPQAKTDFTYKYVEYEQPRVQVGNVIMPAADISFGISGSNLELAAHEEGLMIKPVNDVVARTAAGETRTETLYLKDYYEYYPISLDLEISYGYFDGKPERVEYHPGQIDVSDIFRIPVQDHVQVKVEVIKDSSGGLQYVQSDPASAESGLGVRHDGFVTQNAAYVALTDPGRNGPDYSQIQLGYGLYQMPLEVENRGDHVSVEGLYEQLTNVWPVDYPNAIITAVEGSADNERIYLTTREQDGYWMTVISTGDHSRIARFSIGQMESPSVLLEEGVLAVIGYDSQFQEKRIVAFDMQTWEKWLDASLPADQDYEMVYPVAVYDGTRLAVADRKSGYSRIRLLIFTETGLEYMGELIPENDGHSWILRNDYSDGDVGFTMAWQ